MIFIRIRLANYRVGGVAGLVGQFEVAPAAGVSLAIRLTGKSPKLGSTGPQIVANRPRRRQVSTIEMMAATRSPASTRGARSRCPRIAATI
jgi:hypothetical protein